MKIGVKITLLVVIAVAGIAVISIMSLSSLNSLNNMFTYIGDRPLRNLQLSCEVIDNINIVARNSALACIDTAHANKRLDAMHEATTIIWAKLDTIKNNVVAEHMIQGVKKVEDILSTQKESRSIFETAVNSHDFITAQKIRLGEYADAINASIDAANELAWAANNQVSNAAYVESDAEVNNVTTVLVICIVVVIIVLVIVAIIVIIGVVRPLKKAVEAADKISHGDFKVELESKSKDETGMLIRSMEHMVSSIDGMASDINASIHNALDGNLKYRADASRHQGGYKEMIKGLNDLTEAFIEPIELCAQSFGYIASGDKELQEITKEYKGDFNKITQSINTAIRTLYTVLNEITSTGAAARNGDLSKRADITKVQGAWVEMMLGLNIIMDSADSIINDAGNVLATMATGDLTPRIDNEYKGKFLEMKADINNLGDSLTDLISQLQAAIHTTASASAQISSTSDSLAAATQEQSAQTSEIASAVEEMSRTVTDNAHSATRTANVARQSGDVAKTGGEVVEQTVSKMKEIAEVVRISANNISKLGESSKKIGEIISVIDDIADQTNLLSLNAAIEAARAGEQGRGFAVVADSVGKLAVSTASATKEIADMIKGIQTDTESAVRAMERGTYEVQSGIELADNAGHSIQDILQGINELLDMVNQIAAASEEQSATSEEISKNVNLMNKVTSDSARNIEDVATTANELAKMTETLTSLVSQFKIAQHTNNGRNLV